MKKLALFITLIPSLAGFAAEDVRVLPVIPRPAVMRSLEGVFTITQDTTIHADGDSRDTASRFVEQLRPAMGFPLVLQAHDGNRNESSAIILSLDAGCEELGDEGYALRVTPDRIDITARTTAGVFYACQTLRQLLPPEIERTEQASGVTWAIPCVEIEDTPRFGWRGCMLDSARHFQDKEYIKRFIDLLALHKMNRLHWHLADDQGWRAEIKSRPKLAEIAAFRPNANARLNYLPKEPSDHYGGFHSQDDLREIVAYAEERHVTIVPEIEMPGHCLAALMAYPELSCTGAPSELGDRWIYADVFCPGNDETFTIINDVLSEVADIFPSPWIHIGGDECPKDRWQACPKCQERIKTEGLKDEHELQSYFVRRAEAMLHAKGRRLIGWDEILEGGLAPRATVQSWRNMEHGRTAAAQGHDVVMSPTSHCYLDYDYAKTPVRQTYGFEPIPDGLEASSLRHILGVECCMWLGNVSRRHLERTGEILPTSGIEYQAFPRLIALSEVGWSPKDARDWDDFRERLRRHGNRLDALKVGYYRTPAVWGDAAE